MIGALDHNCKIGQVFSPLTEGWSDDSHREIPLGNDDIPEDLFKSVYDEKTSDFEGIFLEFFQRFLRVFNDAFGTENHQWDLTHVDSSKLRHPWFILDLKCPKQIDQITWVGQPSLKRTLVNLTKSQLGHSNPDHFGSRGTSIQIEPSKIINGLLDSLF